MIQSCLLCILPIVAALNACTLFSVHAKYYACMFEKIVFLTFDAKCLFNVIYKLVRKVIHFGICFLNWDNHNDFLIIVQKWTQLHQKSRSTCTVYVASVTLRNHLFKRPTDH